MRRIGRSSIAAVALMVTAPVAGEAARTVLPIPTAPFDGRIAPNALDSTPGTATPVRAPQGAPNVLLFMSDDTGFAMASTFGGPVPTPNLDRLGAKGQRYNRFHTTGICSPSRAALLTGRNHHRAGVGYLSDLNTPYPGYGGKILPETATIAQVLQLNGWNTAMFGKHHNVPSNERSEAGPFGAWPTSLGFEYFFGFPYGDTDQYSPELYRGVQRAPADEGKGDLLDKRLADDAIRWVHNQKAGAPDKPFLVYLAPGSTHAPHQAPTEWIARFKGQFDQGWDKMREATFKRQLAMGIVPKGTRLTARPAEIPAWDSLTPERKAFAARTMEVAAAMLAYQDAQLGRIVDELQRMGEADNTLFALSIGDNGASAEAGPEGTVNELRTMGVHDESPAWLASNIDKLGGPETYESYPAGWAWAMNTPLRWTKQVASMLGGIRNGMILSWPGHVAHPGSVCGQFSHLVDLVPTILDASGLPMPQSVNGVAQKSLDGESLLPSLQQCDANRPRTQYFEIGGKIGLYHDGWFLSGDDGRLPWENIGKGGMRPPVQWTLYDLTRDFSQSTDVSAREPEKLKEMQALWQQEATHNDVFPIDHRFGPARAGLRMAGGGRKHYDFWGKDVSIPANSPPILFARSFTLNADMALDKAGASGAVASLGSRFGGWSLYLEDGHACFVWAGSTNPAETWKGCSADSLPAGAARLTMRFASKGMGAGATVTLSSGGKSLLQLALPTNYVLPAGGGETFDVGRDLGVTVTDYRTPHGAIEGDVSHIGVDFD